MTEEEYLQHWKKYFYSVQMEAGRRMEYMRRLAIVRNVLISASFLALILIIVISAIRWL